jgi:hypothetical protein
VYSTCLFCYRDLGRNEFVEHFQVGRRLAFDAAKGRLWVVCRGCQRWNLTPLEERWEAIEECERAFSDTKLRVSTDNIGLARVREGLKLVRIGAPKLPEMAAWRYGDQFGRRRRRYFLLSTVPPFLVVAGQLGSLLAGGAFAFGVLGFQGWQMLGELDRRRKGRAQLRSRGELFKVNASDIGEFRIIPTQDAEAWTLVGPRRQRSGKAEPKIQSDAARNAGRLAGWADRAVEYRGDDAVEALRKIMPCINGAGGSRKTIQAAVSQLEDAPTLERYFAQTAWKARETSSEPWSARKGETKLATIAPAMLLGLEMAANEEIERRALEGELSRLEDEWRDAEEIAAIADNMFVPETVQRWIDERRPAVDLSAGSSATDPRAKE